MKEENFENRFGSKRYDEMLLRKEALKKWERAGISDDFIFGKVMRNYPDLCLELLQEILPDLEIESIRYPETQKAVDIDRDARGVRLDVFVMDERRRVYTIEMQMADTGNLPKRSRYYQSMTDLMLLDRGVGYSELAISYIIFICPFDIFRGNRFVYSFTNICKEDMSIALGDGTEKIFLNAKGSGSDISADLKAFLHLVTGEKAVGEFADKIKSAVAEVKKSREWRREYMTLEMKMRESLDKGEDMVCELIKKLTEDNRSEDILKIAEDKELREKLYKEYNIYRN